MITLDDLVGRVTCSVEEAGEALGIGRSAAYRAVHAGQIPSLPLGRALRVPVPRLLELVGAAPEHTEARPSRDLATATDSQDITSGAHDESLSQHGPTSSDADNVRHLPGR